jgi:cellulose synthase/poly-beta-1,6-N-acetylglucosamine synthase-like glycosyltransferase
MQRYFILLLAYQVLLLTMFFPDFKGLGLPEVLSILAFLSFSVLVANYILHYLPLSLFKQTRFDGNYSNEPVSLIICAKNEDENLTEFLPKILSQDYPEFEVIVVNDCSYDNTENVIDEFAKIFPNLRKANIKEDPYYKHGKKFAMLVGIKAAKHNRLVFTDADCYPASDQWLKETAAGFTLNREIVLGYGAYEKQKGFLNRLIRFDTFIIAVQYLSAALKNRPYMGVGRNLAYTKELFFNEKGFSKHYHIDSGDDDLFVNNAATDSNTNVCIQANSVTYSKPEKTFKQWNFQKSRHLSTAPLYSSSTKSRLAFNYFSQYFFYITLFALAFTMKTLLLLPIVLLVKITVQTLILNRATKKLNERDLLAGSALYELLLLFIYPIFHISKLFYKPNKWAN